MMRGEKYGRLPILAGIVLILGSFVSCNKNRGDGSLDGSGDMNGDACHGRAVHLSGSIQMVGSSSMEKLTNALAESFMDRYPDVMVSVQFAGSSAGIAAVTGGSADIGNSSRYLKDEEKDGGVVENIVAMDGIAVCVDSLNPLAGLTRRQLIDIFTGKTTNWKALNGMELPIVVVGREAGSGTRSAFEKQLGIEDQCTYANEVDSTGAVMVRVASTPGAIGYVSTDTFLSSNVHVSTDVYMPMDISASADDTFVSKASFVFFTTSDRIKDTVRLLSLDGAEPVAENIKSGVYPLCRPFVMATKGEISAQSRLVQAWFDYVYSGEGRDIAVRMGLVTLD